MIKTIITPRNNSLNLVIPNNYIGQEKEVLLYAKDKLLEENIKHKRTLENFAGVLSEEDYISLKSHTEKARNEWNRYLVDTIVIIDNLGNKLLGRNIFYLV